MPVVAYCDESGRHHGARVIVMAGLVADATEWALFDKRWRAVLKKYKIPAFHATDCEGAHGRFEAFNRERSDGLQTDLISCINAHNVQGYASCIPIHHYQSFQDQIKHRRGKYWFPYFLVFQHLLELCANHVSKSDPSGQVSFIFDRQKEFSGRAMEIYNSILAEGSSLPFKERLGAVGFVDSEKFRPVQAADLLAYETYRHMKDHKYGTKPARWQWNMLNSKAPRSRAG